MSNADVQESSIELGWVKFWLKLLGSLGWMVASGIAAAVIVAPQTEQWIPAAVGGTVITSIFIWMALSFRKLKKSDEFNQSLHTNELAAGTLWALMFGPLFVALSSIENVFLHVQVDLLHMGFTMLFIQPPAATLFGAMMAQFSRWNYSRRAST